MSRSRLHPHRAAIEEALAAGTSESNIARTYGVARSTLQEFLRGYSDRHNPLQRCQYDTLRYARQRAAESRQRVEEGL